jgi:hypothetical protein
MLQWLYTYVAIVFLKIFSCFIWMLHVFICMLHMFQWLYTYVACVCSKCFTYFGCMLQALYLDVVICFSGYTRMSANICFIISPGFSMVQYGASSNIRTCTQRAVSAQMAKQSLVKVHAHMYSARVGQHTMDIEPGAPTPPGSISHCGARSRGSRVRTRAPTLTLACS